ncbi:MAG: hypothetical protein ACERIH_05170 [Labilibaculum antarcticum]
MLGFISFLSSCENESQDVLVKSELNLLSEAEIKDIGVEHNVALDYVFKELSSIENSGVKSSNDIETIIKAGLNKYSATLFTGEELDNTIEYSNKQVENYFGNKVKSESITEIDYGSTMLSVIKKNREQFSESQIKYLLRCESLFLSAKTINMNSFIEKLDVIEESVKKELTAEEAQVVLIYLSVARNSINYWNGNLNNWINKLSGSNSKSWWNDTWRVVKKIALEDAIGAGVGAVGAAVVNIIPGIGNVTYGSAIVGTAAAGSAYAGVNMIRKHYDCEYIMSVPITIASVLKDDDNLCMVSVNDLSLFETYSDDNIDLTNVALYGDYSVLGSRGTPQDQIVYLYAFKSVKCDYTGEILNIHIDEIEDKSMEISRILVGSTTNNNVIPRPMFF